MLFAFTVVFAIYTYCWLYCSLLPLALVCLYLLLPLLFIFTVGFAVRTYCRLFVNTYCRLYCCLCCSYLLLAFLSMFTTAFTVNIYRCLCCSYLMLAFLLIFTVVFDVSHLLLSLLFTLTFGFSVHILLFALLFIFTVGLFVLLLNIPVKNYGNFWRVSSPNHPFFLGKLDLAVSQYFVHILSLVTDNNGYPFLISGRGRNYFMINRNERMGPGGDRTGFSVHIYHCLCFLYLLFVFLFAFTVCLFCSHAFTVSCTVHIYCYLCCSY